MTDGTYARATRRDRSIVCQALREENPRRRVPTTRPKRAHEKALYFPLLDAVAGDDRTRGTLLATYVTLYGQVERSFFS
ncbi:hypothetical protein [Candidatus Methylacidithermus pantelleriae]|uniref:Uncharacterized protein n=1 Tax=Candidatus Methylacidithermus pantelleriae TaxID=2744239 RepID=A0A8J2FNM8_9BACT|nr:hypothetical protein [Candidatus Methylacidithermus pantelleriae]CAF0693901.1 hypothetical protein MPNT_150011 [Candidatus Methylacidithermus pantelleriae]